MDNPFVPVYTELSEAQKAKVKEIKEKAFELHKAIMESFQSCTGTDARGIAIAKTKLEEVVMWSVKAVANPVSKPMEQGDTLQGPVN